VAFATVGICGMYNYYSIYIFGFCFIIIGSTQSIVFPTLVSIVGAWFPKKGRGFITGLWGTCSNSGNIVGIWAAGFILGEQNEWKYLMFTIFFMFTINACIIWMFFEPYPERLGIVIEEEEELEPEEVEMNNTALNYEEIREEVNHEEEPSFVKSILKNFC
jgi:sugar phosphate permease